MDPNCQCTCAAINQRWMRACRRLAVARRQRVSGGDFTAQLACIFRARNYTSGDLEVAIESATVVSDVFFLFTFESVVPAIGRRNGLSR